MARPEPQLSREQLFFDEIIGSYIERSDFVARPWLARAVEAALDAARYVVVTAEPGAGKTAFAAALLSQHPDWLRYFIRRDSKAVLESSDAPSLLLRIGHQLASLEPAAFKPENLEIAVRQQVGTIARGAASIGIAIEDLLASPFYTTALRVEQEVTTVAGELAGIKIGRATVEPRLLTPAVLSQLALIAPANAIRRARPDARITLVVDGLDEIGTESADDILAWLLATRLPDHVRVLLLSRPIQRLDALRQRLGTELQTITIDELDASVRADVERYVAAHVEPLLRGTAREDTFAATLVERAKGNFAYVTSFKRALEVAIADRDDPMLARLLALNEVPSSLHEFYWWYLALARDTISRLGALEVEQPLSDSDRAVPAWEGVGQRMLGVLAAVRAPISFEQLLAFAGIRTGQRDARNVLRRLLPFLDERSGRYQLFHASLAELVTAPESAQRYPDTAVERAEWERRIVRFFRGRAARWSDVDWRAADDYAFAHLPEHLIATDATGREILQLVDAGFRVAARERFRTELVFGRVVELALRNAHRAGETLEVLSATIFAATVRDHLYDNEANFTPAVLALMARLGRHEEALAHIEAMRASELRFVSLATVLDHIPPEHRAALGAKQAAERLVAAALEIVPRGMMSHVARERSIRQAATALAAHSIERALRLVAADDAGRTEVVRAAAAGMADLDAARAVVERAPDPYAWVALAEREPDPVRRSAVIDRVMSSLPDGRDRWELLARVGASDDAAGSAARAQLLRELELVDLAQLEDSGAAAVVRSAKHLHAGFSAEAEHVLSVIDKLPTGTSNEWSLAAAAALWTDWGRAQRSGPLVDRCLEQWRGIKNWSMAAREIAHLGAIVHRYDQAAGEQLVAEALALVEPHLDIDEYSHHKLDASLGGIVGALIEWDLERALQLAARIPTTDWVSGDEALTTSDRFSAIAVIGLRFIDRDTRRATEILQQCLDALVTPVVLGRSTHTETTGGLYRVATAQDQSDDDGSRTMNFLTYAENTWNYWVRARDWRWFGEPADVVRAIEMSSVTKGARHSYAAVVAAVTAAVASTDLEAARSLAGRIVDPVECAIAWGHLAARKLALGGDASDELQHLQQAIERTPEYIAEVDDDEHAEVWCYLSPPVRACFEAAVRIAPLHFQIGHQLAASIGSRYLLSAVMANGTLRELEADVRAGNHRSLAGIGSVIAFGASVEDPVIADLCRREAVRAIAAVDRALAKKIVDAIEHPAFKARAELELTDGDPAACERICTALAETARPHHVAEVAVAAAELARPRDGATATRIIESATRLVEATPDSILRALGHVAIARASTGRTAARHVRAAAAALAGGNIYVGASVRAELLALALATGDGELVAEVTRAAFADGWRGVMAALERAASELVARGADVIAKLDAAFAAALRVIDPERAEVPSMLDGVAARSP
jgi:hypothetical protein